MDENQYGVEIDEEVAEAADDDMTEVISEETEIADIPHEEAPPKKGRMWVPVLLLVIMFAVGLTFFWITQEEKPVSDSKYPWLSVKDGVLFFDESKYRGSSELEIPAVVAGQNVTSLSAYCFADCDELTIVKLPDTLCHISDSAFEDCDSLRGIFIPESVSTMGSNVFWGCEALESICIPFSVKQIGAGTFTGCVGLSYVFYVGPIESWKQLYAAEISTKTFIIAADQTVKQDDLLKN